MSRRLVVVVAVTAGLGVTAGTAAAGHHGWGASFFPGAPARCGR